MTYTIISKELRGETVWTKVSYLINNGQYIIDVPHDIWGITEEKIIEKIISRGNFEEEKINQIQAAQDLLNNFNI